MIDRIISQTCPDDDCEEPVFLSMYYETGGWFFHDDESPIFCQAGHSLFEIDGFEDRFDDWVDGAAEFTQPIVKCGTCGTWTTNMIERKTEIEEGRDEFGQFVELGRFVREIFLCDRSHRIVDAYN